MKKKMFNIHIYIYIKNYAEDYPDDCNLTIFVLRSVVVNVHAIW